MFSIFRKKTVIPHVRLTGIIGSAGRFKQGMELANQRNILKKAFSVKKISHVAISINSPGGSPVQSHLIYSYIRELADKKKVKAFRDGLKTGDKIITAGGIHGKVLEINDMTILISTESGKLRLEKGSVTASEQEQLVNQKK